ncbi:MAG: prolipoprotein diacylglyceryl transferase [Candidatus Moranbacteria bacterium]|nr:prolipoprotein diacylglyceryl transferase [Candidatus Moranbacteria bacterium]
MLEWYQHIPEHINPIVFSIGSFSVKWYSIMYLAGFLTVYLLLKYRIKESPNKISIPDLMIYLIIGLLIGARLGYVIFYGLPYYLQHPLEIFLPFSIEGYGLQIAGFEYTGFYGMSYFGGLVGVIIAGLVFAKRNNLNFWQLADFVIPAVPAGYFFGRIGNFLNGELYGVPTNLPWGMYFPADGLGLLRHPSQLYEAFLEGIVLFAILWALRNGIKYKNKVFHVPCFMLYLFGYGFFRFFIEFFREPEKGAILANNWLTLGQILSIALIILSTATFLLRRKNMV